MTQAYHYDLLALDLSLARWYNPICRTVGGRHVYRSCPPLTFTRTHCCLVAGILGATR